MTPMRTNRWMIEADASEHCFTFTPVVNTNPHASNLTLIILHGWLTPNSDTVPGGLQKHSETDLCVPYSTKCHINKVKNAIFNRTVKVQKELYSNSKGSGFLTEMVQIFTSKQRHHWLMDLIIQHMVA